MQCVLAENTPRAAPAIFHSLQLIGVSKAPSLCVADDVGLLYLAYSLIQCIFIQ